MSESKSSRRGKRRQPERDPGFGVPALSALLLLSGFASLVYQVLWMRHLTLLFGNSSQAAAATLAMFFAGLGAGSWWWARRVGERPLRLYAMLELGIAGSAVAYFAVRYGIQAAHPWIYGWAGGTPWMLPVKLFMAALLIFPASFFMGGTIPAMAQVVIAHPSRFGYLSAWLYGVNTLGAAIGVVVGAFILLPGLGLRWSYGLALICSLVVAVLSWRGSRHGEPPRKLDKQPASECTGRLDPLIGALAFVSGFVVLALEVVWTRIFAQVHENSVYSFAVILAVVLLCLALGAGISSLLARLGKPARQTLVVLMLVSGGLLVLGPTLLMKVTHNLQPVHTIEGWGQYIGKLFKMGLGGVGYTVIALGTIFPFLMKMAEREVKAPGLMLGRLLAINTLGAILGSLACGFLLLPKLGMWGTLQLLSVIHLTIAMLLPLGWKGRSLAMRGAAVVLILMLFTLLNPTRLPVLGPAANGASPELLEVWEGSDCTVAAVKIHDGHRALLINGGYSLGSTAAYTDQANQSHIPLMLFPKTRSICYIGIGTGSSVAASLDKERHPAVERVLACELSPSVVEAARKWIPQPMNGAMFSDPRCEILIEDGRHHLMSTRERFDMINADLFLPYRRGTGSLYSLDHYQSVASRLNEDGVFVQWLPLYQITDFEFGVIVNTMLQIFDEVSMWRGNFMPGQEQVALVARNHSSPIPVPPPINSAEMKAAVQGMDWRTTTPEMVLVEEETLPFFYAGNLSGARELFKDYPLNTDNHPIIEFQTPWRFRDVARKDQVIWCVGPNFLKWVERILEHAPLNDDPVFKGHTKQSVDLVMSGMAFQSAMIAKAMGNPAEAELSWQSFKDQWNASSP